MLVMPNTSKECNLYIMHGKMVLFEGKAASVFFWGGVSIQICLLKALCVRFTEVQLLGRSLGDVDLCAFAQRCMLYLP